MWTSLETTLPTQLARYAAVIHLRVPSANDGYNQSNPLRVESAEEAAKIDARIAALWAGHPHQFLIKPEASFIDKAAHVLDILRQQVPECCRHHILPVSEVT
jgi:hypothetical protein